MDWVVTIPKSVKWGDYQRELDVVADGSSLINYRTRYFPKEMKVGDRCFLVWDGQVRGWMAIVGLVDAVRPWQCMTTGKTWPPGKYIQRSGPFHKSDGPEMTGFNYLQLFGGYASGICLSFGWIKRAV